MSSKPVSSLEKRLAAHLAARPSPHAMPVEPAPGGPVLDGLDTPLASRSLEAPESDGDDGDVDGASDAAEDDDLPAPAADDIPPRQPPDVAAPAHGPTAGRRHLLPEACLEGVTDAEALGWAALGPGPELVAAVEQLWSTVAADVAGACRPVATPPTSSAAELRYADADPAVDADAGAELDDDVPVAGASQAVVSDAVLLEAVAEGRRAGAGGGRRARRGGGGPGPPGAAGPRHGVEQLATGHRSHLR